MQQYLIQQERDRLPAETPIGVHSSGLPETPIAVLPATPIGNNNQQGRLSQGAVLGGMDPSSDQIMGFPTPPPPPPPTTIADDFRPYSQTPVGPVRPPMRQAMPYGGKGGYYR